MTTVHNWSTMVGCVSCMQQHSGIRHFLSCYHQPSVWNTGIMPWQKSVCFSSLLYNNDGGDYADFLQPVQVLKNHLCTTIAFISPYSHTFYVLQLLYTHSGENFYCYTHITTQHIFRVNFHIRVFSISEKSLIGHFLKGVMFWNYHLIDQTIRKNHETYDGRGVQQNLNFQNQPQDYLQCMATHH